MEKAWATRRANALAAKAGAITPADINAAMQATTNAPGHSQSYSISDGGLPNPLRDWNLDDELTAKLMKLARKKGGAEMVKAEIGQLQSRVRYEASQKSQQEMRKLNTEAMRRIDDKIVCGFIAEMETLQRIHSGLPPAMTHVLNSLTVVKLLDALNRAGWTATGRANGAERIERRQALGI